MSCYLCGATYAPNVIYTKTGRQVNLCKDCMEGMPLEPQLCKQCGNYYMGDNCYCMEAYKLDLSNYESIKCPDCGTEMYIAHGDTEAKCPVCSSELTKCVSCGEFHVTDSMKEISGERMVCEDCFDDRVITCHDCDEYILDTESFCIEDEGYEVCGDCISDYTKCAHCENYFSSTNTIGNGDELCDDCHDSETTRCECCETWFYSSEITSLYLYYGEYIDVCSSCQNNYVYCPDCGNYCHEDEAVTVNGTRYCPDCAENHEEHDGTIHPYNFRPHFKMFGRSKLRFGVELEIDGGGESDAKASRILDDSEFFYAKHDGSLDRGIEFVSMPGDLCYHMNHADWAGLCSRAKEEGYLSHNKGTCGLHVHVTRSEVKNVPAILYLIENNWDNWLRFSRRSQAAMERWASRYHTTNISSLREAQHGGNGRYRCVNFENTNTIEFRMFRGTLKVSTVLATIQMVDHLVKFTNDIADRDADIMNITWDDFINAIPSSKRELKQYLKDRGISATELEAREPEYRELIDDLEEAI